MDWESLYCPNRCCQYYGRPFLLNAYYGSGSNNITPVTR